MTKGDMSKTRARQLIWGELARAAQDIASSGFCFDTGAKGDRQTQQHDEMFREQAEDILASIHGEEFK
jgi:hypothetical protein